MTTRLSFFAFAIGALVTGWCGLGFMGSQPLAFTITVLIAAVYGAGFAELLRYQQATTTLSAALASADKPVNDLEP